MNVYIETNFVLELVCQQEQSSSCEQILDLCAGGRARLVIPAYCLAEPHETLVRKAKTRQDLQQKLQAELLQLARSSSYRARISSIQDIASLLIQSNEEEVQRFWRFRDRLIDVAEIVPLDAAILKAASTYEAPYSLQPQDALVYATVISHLRNNTSSTSCFLNRNSKDFDNPDIVDELVKFNCTMIPRFDHGLGFIQARVQA